MSKTEDQAYYKARALQERATASSCEDNAAAIAHLGMAVEYEKRAAELNASAVRAGAQRMHPLKIVSS